MADFEYGSIDYFSVEGWKSVKITNKNNEMGIFDQQNNFYPLRSFKVKKSSKSVSSFTKWGLPGLLIGGVPGLLLAGFICIRPTFIMGFLHNEKGEMIYVRFDQKGLKAIDAVKVGVNY